MRWLIFMALALGVVGCAQPQMQLQPPGAPALSPIAVNALPGWSGDHEAAALAAFVRGCKAVLVMPADQNLGGIGMAAQYAGQAGLWQNACDGAEAVPPADDTAARSYFTAYFTAYQIQNPAIITGYFEPEYPGSKNSAPGYNVPLFAKPADPQLAGLSRAAIDAGALKRKTPVTAYLADPVDAFMLQIEGSGRILLPNGSILRVGFDGQNSFPYVPIGRLMVADGDLAENDVSVSSISNWLKSHPDRAQAVMEENPNYVYLKPLGPFADNLGAPGTLGVPITAGRTLAVDKTQIPLGTPVFVSTTDPVTAAPLNRLAIAQDTGGGIHGAEAADLFFGAGPQAEAIAGSMRQPGTLYLLLPKPAPAS